MGRMLLLAVVLLVAGGCVRQAAHAPTHEVRDGDTLTAIAEAWRVDVRTIVQANDLTSIRLHPGRLLRIPGGTPPAPAPVAPRAPEPPPPATAWYRPRADWAAPTVNTGLVVPLGTPFRITVHHTAMPGDTSLPPRDMLALIDRAHRNTPASKGGPWACIGYHFIIDRAGEVWEARPLQYQGAHAHRENNRGNIGVCLLGDFDRAPVPRAQARALAEVLDRLRAEHAIARSQVFGHKDLHTQTECPGRHLYALIQAYATALGDERSERPALRATALLTP